MKITVTARLNIADQIVAKLTSPAITDQLIATVLISDDDMAEVVITDAMLACLPVVNRMSLLAQTLNALLAATTAETEVPMCVDTEFEIL